MRTRHVLPRAWRPSIPSHHRGDLAAQAVLALLVLAVGLGLGWRAVRRHDALLTNDEDLGFTDQVIWNFLRGQAFRFTTYQNAEFQTDIDLAAIRRPDSLLAFHVEPILVLLAPLYLVVPDVRAILWLQGIAIALGAIPAYRLARRRLGHPLAGLTFAAVYLLAPPGQWAAFADFHSVALAAPLLLFAVDALDGGHPWLFLLAGLLAMATKEEIGLIVAGLGALALLRTARSEHHDESQGADAAKPVAGRWTHWHGPTMGWPALTKRWPALTKPWTTLTVRRAGLLAFVVGLGWSAFCVAVVIPRYSGGAISPFTARYADLGGSPGAMLRTLVEQPDAYLAALSRPEVLGYLTTLALAGGWLALLAPELLLPAAPVLALNVLSSSPWMAAGRAHYSASVLPLLVAAAIVGAARLVALMRVLVRRWDSRAARDRASGGLDAPAPPPAARTVPAPALLPSVRPASTAPAQPRRLGPGIPGVARRDADSHDPRALSNGALSHPPAASHPPAMAPNGRHADASDTAPSDTAPSDTAPSDTAPSDSVVVTPRRRDTFSGWAVAVVSVVAILGGVVAYRQAGIGPFVDGLAAPVVTAHAERGRALAASIPKHASVSASTALYPHLSQRANAYLFPTVRDAEYVFVDLSGSPYPVAAGGVHQRLEGLLTGGEYRLLAAEDGIVLLKRAPAGEQPLPDRLVDFARVSDASATTDTPPLASFDDGALELVAARIVPSSEVGPRGPLATLETVWRTRRPVPERPRPSITVTFRDGTTQTFENLPVLWWYPPERWRPGELIRLDISDLTAGEIADWSTAAPLDPPPAATSNAPEGQARATSSTPMPSLAAGDTGASVSAGTPTDSSASSTAAGATDADNPAARLAGAADTGAARAGTPADGARTSAGSTGTPTDGAGVSGTTASTSNGSASAPDDAVVVRLGELTARVERDPWRLTLLDPNGRPLWQEATAADDVPGPLGFVGADGQRRHLTRLLDASQTDGGLRLVAATDAPDGRTAVVELRSVDPRTVRVTFTPDDPASVSRVGGFVVAVPGEHFLGFGERFDSADQRGHVVQTWAEDRRDVNFGTATYAPIPWYISSRGYGMLVESDARGAFDVAATHADRVAWEVERPSVSLLVIAGDGPRDILQSLVRLDGGGMPPLPPIWAFGVWKTAVGGTEQVLRDAERIRDEGLPVSALLVYDLVDAPSLLGWPSVDFGSRTTGPYPDARALTDRLHALGFKMLGYKNPDAPLTADVPPDLLIHGPDGQPYVHPRYHVRWVDFTSPAAVAWWHGLWRRILGDLGFDGAMLDLGELAPADARYADGTTGVETHNRYLTLYARASFEAARAVRDDAVLFMRSASLGARQYQSLQWSGDQTVSWDQDGIGGIVPAALSLGLSGFPYWTPEVGGFTGVGLPRPSERELWLRWLQIGALSPLLRDNYGSHLGDPVEVWSDQETIDAFRRYARLHNSLVPYLYSQAKIATETGLPIVRHLALLVPNDPRTWTIEDAYALGDDILVAPVLEEGARVRSLYLPAGQWVDWWTGRAWSGGQVVTVEAPLDQIPIFVRAGAILPLATDADTLAPASAGNATVWNGDLVVRIFGPSDGTLPPASQQRLYDGTTFTTHTEGGCLTLAIGGAPAARGYQIELPAAAAPSRLLVDGQPSTAWIFSDGAVRLSVHAADAQVSVTWGDGSGS